jgi:subtilisin-like proprotein convertase family protein
MTCRNSTIWRAMSLAATVGLAASLSLASGPGKTAQPALKGAGSSAVRPAPAPQPPQPSSAQGPATKAAIPAGKEGESAKNQKAPPAPRPPSGLRGIGNDECSGALSLGNGNPVVINFDNTQATTGVDGQGNSACLFFGSTAIDLDEWFTWTSPVSGTATLASCSQTTVDTKVAVYSGSSCPPGAAIACNDDSCGLQSSVTFPVTSGQVYMFQIGTYPGATPGTGTFTLTATASGGGPANDECSNATLISSLPYSHSGNTSAALPEFGLTACGTTYTNANAVWYRYVGNNAQLEVTTCDSGTTYDTKLHVFRGACGALVCVTGNDDDPTCTAPGFTPPGYRSRLQFCALAGQTYYIMVHGYGTSNGAYTLLVNQIGTCAPTSNDECGTAQTLSGTLPLVFAADTTQGTTGADGQGDPLCFFFGTSGIDRDLWFKWTSTVTGTMILQGCPAGGGSRTDDTKVAVYQGAACPPGAAIACNDDSCGLISLVTFDAVAGQDYLFQIGAYPGSAGGAGNFILSQACTLTPPGGAIPENEPDCGLPIDTVNGGCNSSPPVFTTIQCGQTIHGTAGNNGSTRDTDWFQLTLNSSQSVTWTVAAEFPALIGLVEGPGDGNCANITGFVNPYAIIAGNCSPTTVTTGPIGPGTYWFFVATSGFGGTNCGADYVATLGFASGNCIDAPTGACCAGGGCSITTQAACTGTWLGANSSCTTAGTPTDQSSSPGLAIPDAGCPATVNDTINFGPSFTIADVNVRVQIPDHTWIGDLRISLVHGSTTVVLWNNQCGGNDGLDVTFDDSGAAVTCATPTTGTYRPNQPLNAFNGQNSAGAWTLQVCDSVGADIGTLASWTISIAPPGPSPCPTGPDCFTRGAAGPVGSCPPSLTYNRPTHPTQGHYVMGGPSGVSDGSECKPDWNGDGCRTPADVAGFVTSWFYAANNPGNLDGDYDCNGSIVPSDVASFVADWFTALTSPGNFGC